MSVLSALSAIPSPKNTKLSGDKELKRTLITATWTSEPFVEKDEERRETRSMPPRYQYTSMAISLHSGCSTALSVLSGSAQLSKSISIWKRCELSPFKPILGSEHPKGPSTIENGVATKSLLGFHPLSSPLWRITLNQPGI
jgi:hypothetical protein